LCLGGGTEGGQGEEVEVKRGAPGERGGRGLESEWHISLEGRGLTVVGSTASSLGSKHRGRGTGRPLLPE